MRKTIIAFAVFVAVGFQAVRAQLADIERDFATYVDEHNIESLALLEKVVNINSGTMNFDGVRAVGHVFAQELQAIGFDTRWIDGAPFDRAGHLVAEHKAKVSGGGAKLLLIGHLDTVFEADSPFQRFEMESDHIARGPGIADMKGGDVIMVQALEALHATGALQDMDIVVVMTGDEERSGRPLDLAREALIEAAEWADIAIGFENGDGDPRTAVVSRRGSSGWRLRVTGKPAHSSQIFTDDVGAGAVYETARILTQFYERLSGEQYLTFNPGVVLGGTTVEHDPSQSRGSAFGKSNVVAEHAVVTGDLRAISPAQLAHARETMRGIVSDNLPRTAAEIVFDDGYPPLAPTDGNLELLARVDRVSRDLGFGEMTAVDPTKAGAADVSFTSGLVDMAIDGLGMGGADDHTVDETGDLRTLPMQTKRAAVLMYRLTRAEM